MLNDLLGVYRFLGITLTSLVTVQSNIHPGPDLPGQVTAPIGLYDEGTHPSVGPLLEWIGFAKRQAE